MLIKYLLVGLVAFVWIVPNPSHAFLEGFAQSISQMNQQMTKFVEGLHESVDTWATKVIDNANNEECFFLCPRGTLLIILSIKLTLLFLAQDPIPNSEYKYVSNGCNTFGIQVKLASSIFPYRLDDLFL